MKECWLGVFFAPLLIAATAAPATTTATTSDYNATLLSDFESQAECNQFLSISTWTSQSLYNEDPAYVKHGKGSLHVVFQAGSAIGMPNFYPDFYQGNRLMVDVLGNHYITRENNYKNISSFALDVYPVTRNITLGLSFVDAVTEQEYFLDPVLLEAGRWNTAVFSLDPKLVGYYGIQSISRLFFSFDVAYQNGEDIDCYFDNLRTRNYLTEPDRSLELPHLALNEVMDFEDDYLPHTMHWVTNETKPSLRPGTFRYHQRVDEHDPYVSHGDTSLQIERRGSACVNTSYVAGYELAFPVDYLKSINWASYPINDWDIVVDVYNDGDEVTDFTWRFYDESGIYITNFLSTYKQDPIYMTYLVPHAWNEVHLSLNSPGMKDSSSAGRKLDWSKVSAMHFLVRDVFGSGRLSIYVDYMRLERRNAQ
jgi:hypothetical protein